MGAALLALVGLASAVEVAPIVMVDHGLGLRFDVLPEESQPAIIGGAAVGAELDGGAWAAIGATVVASPDRPSVAPSVQGGVILPVLPRVSATASVKAVVGLDFYQVGGVAVGTGVRVHLGEVAWVEPQVGVTPSRGYVRLVLGFRRPPHAASAEMAS